MIVTNNRHWFVLLGFLLVPAIGGCDGRASDTENGPVSEGQEDGDCSDGADNDGDGLFDCDDDGCLESQDCSQAGDDDDSGGGGPDCVDDDGDLWCTTDGDCDDSNVLTNPLALEICDGEDNDCDTLIDEDAINAETFYGDSDGDGYGGAQDVVSACSPPTGYVTNSDDCDDLDDDAYPGHPEECDGVDNDCDNDGSIDEGVIMTWYLDSDGDGYGSDDPTATLTGCTLPAGYSVNALDCDDGNEQASPGFSEACDGFDTDCNGIVDYDAEGEVDDDGDSSLSCDDCDDADAALGSSTYDADCDGDVDDLLDVQGTNFVSLPAGTFEMGCTAGQSSCASNESPAHSVTLTNDFWLSATEVTQGAWQALLGSNPSSFVSCGDDCPVEHVNWYEALAFANALSASEGLAECYVLSGCTDAPGYDMECLSVTVTSASTSPYDCEGYRLPTEAEWEYAARAGTDLLYSGSDVLDEVGWFSANSGGTTHPVATKLPNAWGLYDLSGNAYEWVWDRYGSDYYNSSPSTDPVGPSNGSSRVTRGGCYSTTSSIHLRTAYRNNFGPGNRYTGLFGFRLSRTIP